LIDGPFNDTGIWRTGYSSELYTLYDKLDIVKVITVGRDSSVGIATWLQKAPGSYANLS
jgi:hypothetical protein